MLPNWIIIGVPRSSTSSLFRWLVDHPQVAGPNEKETYYFVDPGTHMFLPGGNFRDHGLAGYERLFKECNAGASVVLEATPSYLYSKTALRALPELPTRPSFVVVLRKPTAQLQSLYLYFQENWNWIPPGMTFRDFIDAVERGGAEFRGNELAKNALSNAWYSEHLRLWEAAAGRDRMLILLAEDLATDSLGTMRRVAVRMRIDPDFYDSYDFPIENATYVARLNVLQQLNVWLRARLPQGAAYRLLRSIYRAVNTRKPAEHDRDQETERLLSIRYAPMLDELERDFGLDLTAWGQTTQSPGNQRAVRHNQPGLEANIGAAVAGSPP